MKKVITTDLTDSTVVRVPPAPRPDLPFARSSFLVMIYGEDLGRRHEINEYPITVGRSGESDVHLADDSVSRAHCKFLPIENRILLVDLESTNGTYVNGERIVEKWLEDGDRIFIGRSIFKFLSGDNIEQSYHEEIFRLMTTDNLTGALNRGAFQKELQREFYRSQRYGRPLSLIMLDIDHFKQVNDLLGHLTGDWLLTRIARLIARNIRSEDILCRYGGEEFAVLLPEMGLAGASEVAEKLRDIVASASFDIDGHMASATISLGVTEIKQSSQDVNGFLKQADDNLYEAKRSGRNCVRSDRNSN